MRCSSRSRRFRSWNNDIDWDEYEGADPVAEMTQAGYKPRHDLRREHVQRGVSPADVNMGDAFTPEQQEEWVRRTADRPHHHRLSPLETEEIYGLFHMRQYERLLNMGKRRQQEARSFMSEHQKREAQLLALRHAYDAKGRSADLLPGDSGTRDQGGSGMYQTGGDDRTTAEKLRDKQREVQAARDRLASAEYESESSFAP